MTTTVGQHRFRNVAPPARPDWGALWDYMVRQNDEIARAVNPVRSVADGGTGTDTFAAGDILVSTAANSLSRLAIGGAGTVLTVVSGLPAWQSLPPTVSVLDDLTDVTITSPANGHTLRYNSATSQWINTNVLNVLNGAVLNVGATQTSALTSTGYSLTGSNASNMMDFAGTWNTSGNPTALRINITNTASGPSALLLDLLASGSKFSVSKAGNVVASGSLTITGALSGVTTLDMSGAFTGATTMSLAGPITLTTAASRIIPGATSMSLRNTANSADNLLLTDAGAATFRSSIAGVTTFDADSITLSPPTGTAALAITQPASSTVDAISVSGGSLTGSAAQSLLDLAQTWNTSGNPSAILLNITNTASGALSALIKLQVGGTDRFRIETDGDSVLDTVTTGTGFRVNGPAGSQNGRLTLGDTGGQAPFQFVYDSTTPRFYMGFNGTTGADIIMYSKGTGTSQTFTLTAAGNLTLHTGGLTIASATMITTNTAFTNGAGASAGTLTNAPAVGNPTKWIPVSDNGTTRYIPAW